MEDEDFIMGEDSILASTEVNGIHETNTVDPSKIIMSNNKQGAVSPIKEQLLILSSHNEIARSSPSPSLLVPTISPSLAMDQDERSRDLSHTLGSDEMDIESLSSSNVRVRIPPPPSFPPLSYSSSKTGLVYDARMRFHAEPVGLMLKEDDIHPEDPRRIHEIFEEIRQAGLVQGPEESEEDAKHEQCWRIQARYATKSEICLVHTPDHYDFVESLQYKSEEDLGDLSNTLDSIYLNSSTFECARLAAGGAIEACRAVVRGDVRNSIAIIRPPGHHAECDQPSGFCIFNNVPIAAKVCQMDFPEKCRKVLILDWDVHHGNGIQHAFYTDPNVLYVSLHVFQGGKFYPGLPDGNSNYCGDGAGLGKNVNIPWAEHGMGDAEYLYAFQEIIVPIATEFDPDLVIISAGFDAADGDKLGGCHVSPAGYAHMTHMLMRLAGGKIVACLEGGYNLRSIARSALAVTRTLMLQPPDRLIDDLGAPKDSAVRTVEQVRREQSRFWKCMYPKQVDKYHPLSSATQRLHEIIREWQSRALSEEHRMMPLAIKNTDVAETFEFNVLATPRYLDPLPLLVVFHDPPEMMNAPDPVTGTVELHNTWLTDATKNYIDWAIKVGFQVIDVNVPRLDDTKDDTSGMTETDDVPARASRTRDIATYLWENYIEPYDSPQVFFMGVGAPYLGLVEMLGVNENCTDYVNGIQHLIGFVSQTPIHSIKRSHDDTIANWFHEHSLVFVANSHHAWDPNRQRKLRRKYGRLKRSGADNLNEMLAEHMEEVQMLLLEKKTAYEQEQDDDEGDKEGIVTDEEHQSLKSPPLASGFTSPRFSSVEARHGGGVGIKASNGPPVGIFTLNTPRSPRSPMKKTF